MTQTMPLPPLRPYRRKQRAEALAAQILHALGDHLIVDRERDYRREAAGILIKMFMQAGVEVITDEDRRQFGLEPRNEEGWTPHEIVALETSRLLAMVKPIPIFDDEPLVKSP